MLAAWAPLLALLVAQQATPGGQGTRVFDEGQLRSAFAQVFSSLGFESEAAWRTAASVRVLLDSELPAEQRMRTEAFWADGDVRWLAGVNDVGGRTYVNKELFEDLLTWMQAPALLAGDASLAEIEATMTRCREEMSAAGYELGNFTWSGEDEAPEHGTEGESVPVGAETGTEKQTTEEYAAPVKLPVR